RRLSDRDQRHQPDRNTRAPQAGRDRRRGRVLRCARPANRPPRIVSPAKRARRLLAACAAVFLLCACGASPEDEFRTLRFTSFGTDVRVQLPADDARADAAAAAMTRFFETANSDWYAWGDGELARVNAALA